MVETTIVKPKNKTRSAAYPSMGIEEAISAISDLRKDMGKGPYSRETAARGMGHSGLSGAGAAKVAALVHYRLLERQGNVYKQTPLAETIINPLNEEEKMAGLKTAVSSPRLIQRILTDFQGQSMPQRLDAVLARNYGISDKMASTVAKIVVSSLEYTGLLKSGVLGEPACLPELSNRITPPAHLPTVLQHYATGGTPNVPEQKIILPKSGIVVFFPAKFDYLLAMGNFAKPLEMLDELAASKDKIQDDISNKE